MNISDVQLNRKYRYIDINGDVLNEKLDWSAFNGHFGALRRFLHEKLAGTGVSANYIEHLVRPTFNQGASFLDGHQLPTGVIRVLYPVKSK